LSITSAQLAQCIPLIVRLTVFFAILTPHTI
jgi:hypothetical protein